MARRRASDETIAKLTESIVELTTRVGELQTLLEKERERSAARESELLARIDALVRRLEGKKTEKMPRPKDVIRRVDKTSADKKKRQDRRAAHAALRAELPTEIEHHAVPAEQRRCPH